MNIDLIPLESPIFRSTRLMTRGAWLGTLLKRVHRLVSPADRGMLHGRSELEWEVSAEEADRNWLCGGAAVLYAAFNAQRTVRVRKSKTHTAFSSYDPFHAQRTLTVVRNLRSHTTYCKRHGSDCSIQTPFPAHKHHLMLPRVVSGHLGSEEL